VAQAETAELRPVGSAELLESEVPRQLFRRHRPQLLAAVGETVAHPLQAPRREVVSVEWLRLNQQLELP
jgi:hypothetical protein